jgi:uncharacterized membrane protein
MARKTIRRPRPPRPPLLQRLRADFLTGLVVLLPIFLTIYLVWFVPLIPARYNPQNVFGRNIFGLGLVLFILAATAVGALTKGYLGLQVIRFGEGLVGRMPIIRSVYNALKQIAETMLGQSSASFQRACLIEFPRKGLWAVAFVATPTRGEIPARAGEPDMVTVFLPKSPNPTNGFLLFVPRRDIVLLDMTVEEAAKLVISAGLVAPPETRPPAPTPAPARPRPSA